MEEEDGLFRDHQHGKEPVVMAPQHPHTPRSVTPHAPSGYHPGVNAWSTGIFEFYKDFNICLLTWLFPCVTFGHIANVLDEGTQSCEMAGLIYTVVANLTSMPWMVSYSYRTELRMRFDLAQDPAHDCLTHLCCEQCALCQEYRELKIRGIDPSIGAAGHALRKEQVKLVPPRPEAMM